MSSLNSVGAPNTGYAGVPREYSLYDLMTFSFQFCDSGSPLRRGQADIDARSLFSVAGNVEPTTVADNNMLHD